MWIFFPSLLNEMQHWIRKLYSSDRKGSWRSVRIDELKLYSTDRKGTYDPYELNEPNLRVTDRYDAGVLNMCEGFRRNTLKTHRALIFLKEENCPLNIQWSRDSNNAQEILGVTAKVLYGLHSASVYSLKTTRCLNHNHRDRRNDDEDWTLTYINCFFSIKG